MDYEKEYKKIVGKIKKAYLHTLTDSTKAVLEEIYPELAEREDEKVRKELLDFCKNRAENYPNDTKYKNISAWITWLEKQGEQKHEWSEEDKNFMYDTLSNLTELKDRYGEGYGNVGRCIDWLKSLRTQNKWKPSDEQMEILLQAVAYFGVSWANKDYLVLQSLYFDLKKLEGK